MLDARTRRLGLCLLMSAFALGSVSRVDAEVILFANGRTMSVKSYRMDGDTVTVTLRHGGEATFDKALVAEIRANELPDIEDEPKLAPIVTTQINWQNPIDAKPFSELIETVALKHGVDPKLVHAVVQAESNYDPRAKSNVGARGLMQVMPSTGRDFGIGNLYDPEKNLEAGVQYLKFLLERFPDSLSNVIAAYNAGPTTVRRYNGIPPYQETRQYVKKVLKNFRD
jgi:soluble lytic murein transglycosylase-like protein